MTTAPSTRPSTRPTGTPHPVALDPIAPEAGEPEAGEPEAGEPDRVEAELARFPVLAEVPGLEAALEAARRIDRLTARLIEELMTLQEHELAERATGVALEQWLAIVGRRTGADRRMLLTAGDTLRRLPSLRDAFLVDGTVSWAQTRAVVLRVHRLPRHLDDAVDHQLARAIAAGLDTDPDALVHRVGWIALELDPSEPSEAQRRAEDGEFLALQPRLDGSGGRVFGDFGPVGFATLDAALSGPPAAGSGPTRDGFGRRPDEDRSRASADATGRRRAARLLELCEGAVPASGGATDDGAGRPQLLVRVDLSTLLDRDQLPAELLTTLTGGRMWASAQTVRDLIAARGADLRSVILDDTGAVVGVGRSQRLAPGWLRDALLARHDTCSAPGCRTAARVCDADHAHPWHPVAGTDAPPGRTDVDELAPLCRTDNGTKERDGWRATQHPDGSRTWHHPRTGLTTRTVPARWRPPPRPDITERATAPP
jgi:hypothetical protein